MSLIEVSEQRDGVRVIALNRPEKRNALNVPLLEALCDAVEAAGVDPGVRVVVLRGQGPVFCAGLDLQEAMNTESAHRSADLIARMLETIYHCPKPTIAAVHGAAIAGGCGLMSACDLAIASVDTKFGYPEVRRGLVAGLVMTFLRRQVQERHVRELLLLGEIIDGERAEQIGLINRCVPTDMLDDALQLWLDQLLKGSPEAIKLSKTFLDTLHQRPVREDLDRALELHVTVRNSGDAQEGFRAFLEKRNPAWQQPS